MVQIGRKETPDKDARIYTSRERLTSKDIETVLKGKRRCSPMAHTLLEIDGIAMVQLCAYHVMVCKASKWGWEEIEPSILRLLGSFNAGEGKLLEVVNE